MQTDLLNKIKKLHALSGNNPSEAEAALAAQKVQALLREHNLSMSDVQAHNSPQAAEAYEKSEVTLQANQRTIMWKAIFFNGIAKLNFCFVVRHSGTTRVSIVGKRSNVEAVVYMADVLTKQIERLAMEASRSVLQNRARYQLEFCSGASLRIIERLKAEQRQAETQSEKCTALVQVSGKELSRAVSQYFPHLRTARRRTTYRTNGYSDGSAAGAGMNVSRGGIEGGRNRGLLQ